MTRLEKVAACPEPAPRSVSLDRGPPARAGLRRGAICASSNGASAAEQVRRLRCWRPAFPPTPSCSRPTWGVGPGPVRLSRAFSGWSATDSSRIRLRGNTPGRVWLEETLVLPSSTPPQAADRATVTLKAGPPSPARRAGHGPGSCPCSDLTAAARSDDSDDGADPMVVPRRHPGSRVASRVRGRGPVAAPPGSAARPGHGRARPLAGPRMAQWADATLPGRDGRSGLAHAGSRADLRPAVVTYRPAPGWRARSASTGPGGTHLGETRGPRWPRSCGRPA